MVALVSVMDLDKGVAKTIMYYNRGDSFGELAIMNGSRRQSTVISKDNIQLLVLTDTVTWLSRMLFFSSDTQTQTHTDPHHLITSIP